MNWFLHRPLAIALFSCLAVEAGACGGSHNSAKSPSSDGKEGGAHAEVGKPAPDLSIQTINGKGKISLESLSGKVAVVDFWATWCGPCKKSFPKLEELSKQNEGKVQVIGISVDDKQDGVADFAKENGATFAIGWDDGHTIAKRWGVDETMPTTYVVDATGTVRYIHAGYRDGEGEELAKEIATLSSESGSKGKTDVASNKDSGKSDPTSKDSGSSDASTSSASTTAASGNKDDATASSDDKPADTTATKPKKGGKGGKKGAAKKPGTAPKKKPQPSQP